MKQIWLSPLLHVDCNWNPLYICKSLCLCSGLSMAPSVYLQLIMYRYVNTCQTMPISYRVTEQQGSVGLKIAMYDRAAGPSTSWKNYADYKISLLNRGSGFEPVDCWYYTGSSSCLDRWFLNCVLRNLRVLQKLHTDSAKYEYHVGVCEVPDKGSV